MTPHRRGIGHGFPGQRIHRGQTSRARCSACPPGASLSTTATISGVPTALAVNHRRTLFIGTKAGHVLAVDRSGAITEICHRPKSVAGLTIDRDGSLLIATGGEAIIRINRSELMPEKND